MKKVFGTRNMTLAGILAAFVVLVLPLAAQASLDCIFYTGCERKICELENEIESALDHGNTHKADKLKRELEAFRSQCPGGVDTSTAGDELSSIRTKVREFQQEMADIRREFGKKMEEASSFTSRSKALEEIGEEVDDAVDDVAEVRGDLREDVDEFLDEMADLGAVTSDSVTAAKAVILEIEKARSDLNIFGTIVDTDLSGALSRIGADSHRSDFKGEMEDISDEIGKQREALKEAERAAQAVIDRAS